MNLFITTANCLNKGCKLKEQNVSSEDRVTILYNNADSSLSMETVNFFLTGNFDKEFIETTKENLNIITAFYLGEAVSSKKYSDIIVMEDGNEFAIIEELMNKNNIDFSIIKNNIRELESNKEIVKGKRGRKPGSTKKKIEPNVGDDIAEKAAFAV